MNAVLVGVQIALNIITVWLHTLCLVLLLLLEDEKVSQRKMLMSLCIVEICLSADHVILCAMVFFPSKTTSVGFNVFSIVHYKCYWIAYLVMMIVITADRFLCFVLNVKYPIYITKRRVDFIVAGCWLVSLSVAGLFMLLNMRYGVDYLAVGFRYIYPILDAVVVVLTIAVYVYFYLSVKAWKAADKKAKDQGPRIETQRSRAGFRIPILIVATFVIFLYAPDMANLIMVQVYQYQSLLFNDLSLVSYSIGLSLDALICMYFNRHVRIKLAKILFPGYYERKVHPALVDASVGGCVARRATNRELVH